MKELKGNAWDILLDYDVLCITTNGTIKTNGECVMGAGIAKTAKNKIPLLPLKLGGLLKTHGNRCFKLTIVNGTTQLVSFPVKHNWWEVADLELIRKSTIELVEMADKFDWNKILLPRAGCGNGKLSWSEVKPIMNELLDDRFYIISF